MTDQLKPCPFCGSNHVDPIGWLNAAGKTGPECCVCGATAASVGDWNARHIPEGSSLSPELTEKIDKIAENARWCSDTIIDDLVEWLCRNGHQGQKFRSQVERYKQEQAEIKSAQNLP